MALTPTTSALYDLQAAPGRRARGADVYGRLRVAKPQHTATGTGQATISMVTLPAGRIRVFSFLSAVSKIVAAVAAEVLAVGYAAYTNMSGTAVAADTGAFGTSIATPTTVPTFLTLPAVGYTDFETENGLTITFTSSGGDTTSGEVTELVIVYEELDT